LQCRQQRVQEGESRKLLKGMGSGGGLKKVARVLVVCEKGGKEASAECPDRKIARKQKIDRCSIWKAAVTTTPI